MENQATDRGGAGLHNLKMRAEAIGGVLTLGQNPAGQGTSVTVTLPL
jgi:signal transduction histidine kinase